MEDHRDPAHPLDFQQQDREGSPCSCRRDQLSTLAARVAKRNEVGSHSGHPHRLLLTRQQAHRLEASHLRPDALALEQIYWYLVTPEDLFLKENIYIRLNYV